MSVLSDSTRPTVQFYMWPGNRILYNTTRDAPVLEVEAGWLRCFEEGSRLQVAFGQRDIT